MTIHFMVMKDENTPAVIACGKHIKLSVPHTKDPRNVSCRNCLKAIMKEADTYVDGLLDDALEMWFTVYREAYFNFHSVASPDAQANEEVGNMERFKFQRENERALSIKLKKIGEKYCD